MFRTTRSRIISLMIMLCIALGLAAFESANAVSIGSKGDAVAVVQAKVNATAGCSAGPVDGLYGPMTARGVRCYQAKFGLVVDGWAGPQTHSHMGLSYSMSAPVAKVSTSSSRGRCSQYHGLLAANSLPVAPFDRIMWRESGCNPNAYNGRGADRSYGLLQLNNKGKLAVYWQRLCGASGSAMFNPAVNIRCAAAAYKTLGLKPWS